MNREDLTHQLKQAVEAQYGGKATFVQVVPVHEDVGGHLLWDSIVYVFDLKHNPNGAFRAYAWSYVRENGEHGFATMLHSPKVGSPRDAVRVEAERREGNA